MKSNSIVTTRYPSSRQKLLSNLAISVWFPGAKAEVDKTGSAKRKAQWASLKPMNMKIEPPVIFHADKFVSCIVDRKAGILLKDKEVPLIDFATFLKESDAGTSVVKTDVKLADLYALIQDQNSLASSPVFYLANIDGSADYTVIYDSKSDAPTLETLIKGVFRGYDFESITLSALESTDEDAKKLAPVESSIDSFYTGTVNYSDRLFIEKSGSFKLIDLNLLASVVAEAKKAQPARNAKGNKNRNSSESTML